MFNKGEPAIVAAVGGQGWQLMHFNGSSFMSEPIIAWAINSEGYAEAVLHGGEGGSVFLEHFAPGSVLWHPEETLYGDNTTAAERACVIAKELYDSARVLL